jgi:hypothetical protein
MSRLHVGNKLLAYVLSENLKLELNKSILRVLLYGCKNSK